MRASLMVGALAGWAAAAEPATALSYKYDASGTRIAQASGLLSATATNCSSSRSVEGRVVKRDEDQIDRAYVYGVFLSGEPDQEYYLDPDIGSIRESTNGGDNERVRFLKALGRTFTLGSLVRLDLRICDSNPYIDRIR